MRALAGLSAIVALVAACSAAEPGFPQYHRAGGAGSSSGGGSSSGDGNASSSSGSVAGNGGAPAGSSGGSSSSGSSSGGVSSSSGSSSSGSSSGGGSAGGADAGPGADSGGTGVPVGDAGQSLEDLCVATINSYRATIGRPPYTRWTSNEACTSTEAQKDSVSGVAHSAFGACNELGQCECPGWPGPLDTMITGCLQQMWAEGPGGGHYDIMASGSYTSVACGFYTMADGSIWAAQNYQ